MLNDEIKKKDKGIKKIQRDKKNHIK